MESQIEDKYPDMNVDDAAAALGFSTTLSDTMLQPMLDAQNMPIEDEASPTGEEVVQDAPVRPETAQESQAVAGPEEDDEERKKEAKRLLREVIEEMLDEEENVEEE